MSNEVNKGGRPVGSTETPLTVLSRELRMTVKTIQDIREMMAGQIRMIETHLLTNPELSIITRLEALERLGMIMTTLTKNVEILGKYSVGDASRRKGPDDGNEPAAESRPTSSIVTKLLGK